MAVILLTTYLVLVGLIINGAIRKRRAGKPPASSRPEYRVALCDCKEEVCIVDRWEELREWNAKTRQREDRPS